MGRPLWDTGLDRAVVRPPAFCPSRATTNPSLQGLARPSSRLPPTSKPGTLIPWKIMNPNPEGSSHLRAGQTGPPPLPQESGVLWERLCCQLRITRAKHLVLWGGTALTILPIPCFKSVLQGSASHHGGGVCPTAAEAGGCCRASAAGGSHGHSAFRPCVPKACCVPTVCLGKTNEKHNLKVIWNVYVGPMHWIKAGPWKAGKECAV